MKKRKYLPGLIGILLLAVSGSGFTAAYLSKYTEKAGNVITAGAVEIELKEERWKADAGRKIYPGEKVEKDPVVKNIGDREANVFLEVIIPVERVSIVDQNTGIKTQKEEREIFTFQADQANWELLKQEQKDGNKTYVYGYKQILEPGEQTTPLFEQFQVISYVEGELDKDKNYNIPVCAKAIQTMPEDLSLPEVYEEYLNQFDVDSKEMMG